MLVRSLRCNLFDKIHFTCTCIFTCLNGIIIDARTQSVTVKIDLLHTAWACFVIQNFRNGSSCYIVEGQCYWGFLWEVKSNRCLLIEWIRIIGERKRLGSRFRIRISAVSERHTRIAYRIADTRHHRTKVLIMIDLCISYKRCNQNRHCCVVHPA